MIGEASHALVLLGLDPGGENSFGWASLRIGQSDAKVTLATGHASTAASALTQAADAARAEPNAVAIDAPLFWVSEGDRKVDAKVRKMVCAAGGKSGTVAHVNSLRGACLVQGILAAKKAAEIWPSVNITEAHPKALLRVHSDATLFLKSHLPLVDNQHQRDAAIAAYTAWAFASRLDGWCDLARDEDSPFFPSGRAVSYWFPRQRT